MRTLYERLEENSSNSNEIPEDLAQLLQIGDFYTQQEQQGSKDHLKCELDEGRGAGEEDDQEEEDSYYPPADPDHNFIDDYDDEGPARPKRKYTKRK